MRRENEWLPVPDVIEAREQSGQIGRSDELDITDDAGSGNTARLQVLLDNVYGTPLEEFALFGENKFFMVCAR